MATRDVRVRLDSTFNDRGFKSAEQSASIFERELVKLENEQRRMATLQMQAAREMAAAEQQKAAAIVAANDRQRAALLGMGQAVGAASLATAVGLGLTVKAAIDWESAWAGVTKTVDGSGAQMEVLEGQLRSLARSLPATHQEIAQVAENAGQLGVKRKDIAAFTETMIALGETTNLSADEAATSFAQFGNVMGVAADESDRLGSTVVALGNAGASTERDIINLGLRIAGAGRSAGLSAQEVLGIASALSSVGLEAEAGGTAISRVITDINSAVQSGSDKVEDFASIAGMSAADFAEKWRGDPAVALNDFVQGLGRMQASGADTATVLNELGFADVRVADTLRRASLAGDVLTDSLVMGSKAWEENLALTLEADKRYETAESRIQVAKNSIADTAITIGGQFLPAVASGAEGVANLAAGFSDLPTGAQSFITTLGSVATGAGLLVGGASVAIPKLQQLKTSLDDLNGGSSRAGKAIGGLASVLTGPWGIALAAATAGLGLWMAKQGETRRRVEEMTSALDEQTGAVTDNYRAMAAQQLADSGTYDAARRLGIELKTVTDAALGNAAAQREVAAALAEVQTEQEAVAAGRLGPEMHRDADAVQTLRKNLDGQNETLQQSQQRWRDLNEATGESADSTGAAAAGQEVVAGALGEVTGAAEDTTDALDDLVDALDNLNGPTLNVREAERQLVEAVEAVTAAVKENEEAGAENARTLDINTEAGRRNQEALDGLARAAAERAEALLRQTGSESQFRGALEQSRQALFDQARQFYDTDDAAWAYVDSVLAIPVAPVTTPVFNSAAAEERIAAFKRILAMPSVVITPEVRASNPYYANRADGGVIDYYANGGVRESHVAQIAPASQMRVWAEPETGGEGYIPLALSKRQQSEAILAEIANRFGGMYLGPGAGAALAGASAPSRTVQRTLTVHNYGTAVTQREIMQMERELEWLAPE